MSMNQRIRGGWFCLCVIAACSRAPEPGAPSPSEGAPRAEAPDRASVEAFFAALKARDTARVEALLQANAALAGTRTQDGDSAVMSALFTRNGPLFVRAQDNPLLAAVLARKPPLDLFEAAATGDAARVGADLKRNPAVVKAVEPSGWTLLHFAAFAGQTAVVELLVSAGADLEARAQNRFLNTPLQVAMLTEQEEVARRLIAKGANVNARQDKGFTPLHEAALLGNRSLIRLLLDAGADVNAATEAKETALDMARKKDKAETIALLRERGAREGQL